MIARALFVVSLLSASASPARAEERSEVGAGASVRGSDVEADLASRRVPSTPLEVGPVYRAFGGVGLGRGIRFNNPYRLGTELGDDAESLSLTAYYLGVHLGAAIGGRGPLSHGVSVHGSFALDGIPQEVITPSYVATYRDVPRWGLRVRAGVPIVVEPDLSAGFELAAGGILNATAGVGFTADLVGSVFYGAATLDSPRTAIPIVSLEIGVVYDFEVLP